MTTKPLIFVVISFLIIALIYSSFSTSGVFAAPRDPSNKSGLTSCTENADGSETCCWREKVPGQILAEEYCQTCDPYGGENCTDKELQYRVAPPPTSGQTAPADGVLEQPPSTPRTPGQGGLPQDGVLEQPRTVEPPVPTCVPGTVLDPDINECVLENPPELCPDGSIPQLTGPGGTQPECPPSEAEEPQAEEPEQPAEEDSEQQQSSEEGDGSSEDNSNNN